MLSQRERSALDRHITGNWGDDSHRERSNDTHSPQAAEDAYVHSIRNTTKQAYAKAYLVFLRAGGDGPEPERGDLSYMAAQAVRLRLWELGE